MCGNHSQTSTAGKQDDSSQQQIRASVLHGARDLRIVRPESHVAGLKLTDLCAGVALDLPSRPNRAAS